MANARIAHLSLDGSTDQFDVTFPYISQSHVIVFLDGSATTAFTWLTSTRIQMNSMPASGTDIIITRQTSPTVRLVDYQTGSILSETILDTDSKQAFFLCQEAIDFKELALALSDTNNQWDATNKRLTNVANPTSDQDAVTKHYLENTWLSASDKTSLSAISGITTQIGLLGTSDAVSDINLLATSDIISDMNTLATADVVSDMNTLATSDIVSDMNTLATSSNVTNMNTLAGIAADITSAAGVASNITTVAGITSDITAVAGDATDIGAVAAKATEIGRLGTADAVADMAILATTDVVADMAILATTDVVADMNTLGTSDVVADMNTLATSDVVADMNTLGTSDVVSDMNTLATSSNVSNMDTVATNIANVNTTAGAIANINTTATNITSVNTFANRYRVDSTDPSSSLDAGDLVYNTSDNQLKYYNGTQWEGISADTDVKTKVSSNDTTAGFLNGKLVAGTNVTFTEGSDGGNETLTIASTDTNTDVSAKVSANDTTAGFLNGKLLAGTNVTFAEGNDGGNETLTINAVAGASVGLVLALGG